MLLGALLVAAGAYACKSPEPAPGSGGGKPTLGSSSGSLPAVGPVKAALAKAPEVLDQGWGAEEREEFWFTPQGTLLLPYDWFLGLERADGTELMRSARSMDSYRHIPMPPSKLNPDGLALGFTKDRDRRTGESYLGLTCAACHTAKLELGQHVVLIDGGPTLADFKLFLHDLRLALQATHDDAEKLERFAQRVQAPTAPAAVAPLKAQLREQIAKLGRIETHDATPVRYGFARLDAFGAILNNVAANGLGVAENAAPPNAPVSFPFVWDTPQSDRVQWNGAARNIPLVGALIRNVGEVLGVFGGLDLQRRPSGLSLGYDNSVDLKNLGKLENLLKGLWSPAWDAKYLPAIDTARAERGAAIFADKCASCHALLDSRNPARSVKAVMTPVPTVGTDPTMAKNYLERRAKTGPLKGKRLMVVAGPKLEAEARTFEIVINAVSGVLLRHPLEAIKVGIEDAKKNRQLGAAGFEPKPVPAEDKKARGMLKAALRSYVRELQAFDAETYSYKARPLNGIWATAPYLHNGSVPNLWALLQPAHQRPAKFWVGSRRFDPKRVGLESVAEGDNFEFDTSLVGNSNAGHSWGTQLAVADKWSLLEYLKTL